jgi:hypothetical protein
MYKKFITVLLIFLFSWLNKMYCIDTISTKYLPLKIGNIWVYDHYILPSFHVRVKCQVTGDTLINGHVYYRFNSRLPYMHNTNSNLRLYRIDSVTGLVLAYNQAQSCSYHPNEMIMDSLGSKINNIASSCPVSDFRILTDTSNLLYFGSSFKRKRFQIYNGQYQIPSGYLFGIGLTGTATGSIGEEGYNLYGCVINGIVYGDTSLTGVNKISSEIPKQFSLSQNYPNPFNPITKIKFAVPKTPLSPPFSQRGDVRRTGGFITLKVFDILGREIQTLVNEQLSPGTYEVEFDGTNYSSGVYYYTLSFRQAGSSTGDYVETKKMLLIK